MLERWCQRLCFGGQSTVKEPATGGNGFKKPSHTSSVAVPCWPGVFPKVKPSLLSPGITQPWAPSTLLLRAPIYPDGPSAPHLQPPTVGSQTPGDLRDSERALPFSLANVPAITAPCAWRWRGNHAAAASERLIFAVRVPLPGISRCAGPSGSPVVVSQGFAFPTG